MSNLIAVSLSGVGAATSNSYGGGLATPERPCDVGWRIWVDLETKFNHVGN